MDKQNYSAGIGVTVGVVIGFMAGMLLNIIFIPILIALGFLYDQKMDE